ncbi:MAG: SDR family oxidoreductase [Acidobacteriota bacterium]|nr:MAG: SDR family oxidoreductase [Acidobacteriota bacterium]
MLNVFSLENETALITGGGTGLGLGIARCFVEAGARVMISGRRREKLEEAAQELGPSAGWILQDVRDPAQNQAVAEEVRKRLGSISILVNNAGIHLKKSAVEHTPEEFESVLQTHVVGAFGLTRAVLPEMLEQGRGNILFIASMASLFGLPNVVAYSAAKAAYLGMVRSLAVEVSPRGVRVNAIAPGWIESDMMRAALSNDPARSRKILGRTPLKRFGDADDIGWAATYLCSRAAGFVTGVVLPVDGGASIGF